MASMKDYLEKAMLRLGSRGAMPGGVAVVILSGDQSNTSASPITYVAPFDGLICACTKNGSPAGNLHMYNATGGNIFSAYSPAGVSTRIKGCISAKKGDKLQIGSYQSALIIDRVEFIKSVGGGLSG